MYEIATWTSRKYYEDEKISLNNVGPVKTWLKSNSSYLSMTVTFQSVCSHKDASVGLSKGIVQRWAYKIACDQTMRIG